MNSELIHNKHLEQDVACGEHLLRNANVNTVLFLLIF